MVFTCRNRFSTVFLFAVLAVSLVKTAEAQSKVAVVNQPCVKVPAPIPHTEFQFFEAIPISANQKTSVPLLLETEGFSHAMLSIAAEVEGSNPSYGTVTATLIPDVPFIAKAFEEDGVVLFPISVAVSTFEGKARIFGSQPVQFPISFPRYRVYFKNASDRSVKVYLYVNLAS